MKNFPFSVRPLGERDFVRRLEMHVGRPLEPLKPGRKQGSVRSVRLGLYYDGDVR